MSVFVKNSQDSLRPLMSLKVLYDSMPATSGCEKCSEINGEENKDWCCKRNSPSMYYVEFLKAYESITTWKYSRRKDLLLRAIKNYLDNRMSKPCIFYDNGCTIYQHRPLACRLYGCIPEETWTQRWNQLKKQHGDNFDAEPQCSLVSSEREITIEDEEKWFNHTRKCELRLGVPSHVVQLHDDDGGSYRSAHDHLLLEMMGEDFLAELTNIRLQNPPEADINSTIEQISDTLDERSKISQMSHGQVR